MSFEAYWQRLLRHKKNECLRSGTKLTLTVESFRQCLSRAYEHGRSEGDAGKSMFQRLFG